MPSQPALIFVTPAFGATALGGLAVSARRIVKHLAEAYAVTVVTPSDLMPAMSHRVVEHLGVKLVEVGKVADQGLFLQFLADVIETLSLAEPAPLVLSFYCNAMAYATTLTALRRGTQPLLFARGNDIDLEIFGDAAFPIHYALSHAQTVFCVSRELQSKVHAFCPTAHTCYIPNGLEVGVFAFQEGFTPHSRPVIGLFGDIKQKKGLDTLLAALDFERYSLRIVGELREESRKLLHGYVSLHPQTLAHIELVPYALGREDLLEQYRGVDIVCVPSRHEGMSNVMLEAMALGKLCVCSAVGGALDVVLDGENGFLFDPACPESLGLALAKAAACLRGGHELVRRQAAQTIRADYHAELERERYLAALRAIAP